MTGDGKKAPPSTEYSILNPVLGATTGKTNAAAQVFAGAVMTGAAGNTTALITPDWQAAIELVAFAAVDPHATVNLYLALIVQQPETLVSKAFAVANDPYALNAPPGGCTAYSAVNDEMTVTAVIGANAALHELAMDVMTGANGKITMLTELLDPHDPAPVVPANVEPHVAVKT